MNVSPESADRVPVGTASAESRSRIDTHLTILAVIHIAFGAIGVLMFALALFMVVATGVWMWQTEGVLFGTTIAAFVLAFFVLLSLPGIVGGVGVLLRQGWARILLLIVGFIQLMNIPFGTVLGIYTIWVLLREDARAAFSGPRGRGGL